MVAGRPPPGPPAAKPEGALRPRASGEKSIKYRAYTDGSDLRQVQKARLLRRHGGGLPPAQGRIPATAGPFLDGMGPRPPAHAAAGAPRVLGK